MIAPSESVRRGSVSPPFMRRALLPELPAFKRVWNACSMLEDSGRSFFFMTLDSRGSVSTIASVDVAFVEVLEQDGSDVGRIFDLAKSFGGREAGLAGVGAWRGSDRVGSA
jgi:hypothetical protein